MSLKERSLPPDLAIIYATRSNTEWLGADGPEFISSYYCNTESVWLEVLISSREHRPFESINKLQLYLASYPSVSAEQEKQARVQALQEAASPVIPTKLRKVSSSRRHG